MNARVAWACASIVCLVAACGPSEVPLGQPDAPSPDQPDAFVLIRRDAPVADARPPDGPRADARPTPDAPPGTPDAPIVVTPDAPAGAPDAPTVVPPDAAATGPTVSIDPPVIYVSRGGTAGFNVVLGAMAQADTTITLSTVGGSASVPTSVLVSSGASETSAQVTGLALGDVTVDATTPGGRHGSATVHVVPAILSVTPGGPNDVLLDTPTTYTVTLDDTASIDVPVSLTVDDPTVLGVPARVTVGSGSDSATFHVSADHLGVSAIHAAIGDGPIDVVERVNGLFMSEVLYDAVGADGGLEWIEFKNATDQDITLDGIHVYVATTPPFVIVADLLNVIPAGTCAAIDMPGALGTIGILPNGTDGDGIRIVVGADQVIDEVVYGDNNNDLIPDENGVVAATTDVPDVPAGDTIARDLSMPGMPWRTDSSPTKGNCTNF